MKIISVKKLITLSLFVLIVGFKVVSAAGNGHVHNDTCGTGCNHDHGPSVTTYDNDEDFFGRRGFFMRETPQLQKAKTIRLLLHELEALDKKEDHHHNHHDLDAEGKAKIKRALERELAALTIEPTYGKAILKGLGSGVCGNHYKDTGEPTFDIIAGVLGKATEPAGYVIATQGKSFWTWVFNAISNKWNKVSNVFFGTATFTTRELENWKLDIKDMIKAFEEAYKRGSSTSANTHGLALRSAFSAPGAGACADEQCADAACGDHALVTEKKPEVVQDPVLASRKMFCQLQIKNILSEVAVHKMASKSHKGLWERATQLEIALQALHDCIARQTSLQELSSAVFFDEICVWRDLAASVISSMIAIVDPLADKNKLTTSTYGGSYGAYGSSAYYGAGTAGF